jgi:hypothetical protein
VYSVRTPLHSGVALLHLAILEADHTVQQQQLTTVRKSPGLGWKSSKPQQHINCP